MLNQTQSKLSIIKLTAAFLAILGFATTSHATSPFAQNDAVKVTHSAKGEKSKCGEGKCGANEKVAQTEEANKAEATETTETTENTETTEKKCGDAKATEKKCGDAKAEKKCG